MKKFSTFLYFLFAVFLISGVQFCRAADNDDVEEVEAVQVEADLGSSREASRTDDEVVIREEEAILLDGLNVAQVKELRDKSEKFTFQAEVNRMMKLIINSLYRNKEIFLRELISNASDALDKIRLLSLTDMSALDATEEQVIRIKADKDNHVLHITDTGVGMTKQDLINNLGTIAKSGTSEFLGKLTESAAGGGQEASDLIGQFGVGFYSAFLVADRIVVTTKHNDDRQQIWESDASSFSVVEDPRGDTLKRGTTISLYLKEEAYDFLEQDTVRNLILKYSQFINFKIYLWDSKTEMVEEPVDDDDSKEKEETSGEDEDSLVDEDEEGKVEDEKDEEKPKTKKVEKTTWNWELVNDSKPIWTRKPSEIEDSEYHAFYKSLTKESEEPLAKVHFVAEGEVTFKSLLFIPKVQQQDMFNRYGKKTENIKLYVRRVFITDDFQDMMPSYLNFVRGIVDSDDLPLNVSRETLQQHKLLKVIKKKLVRKTLDMIKKIDEKSYEAFWKEYSTNVKLGLIEDSVNRSRLAKLLRFQSSNAKVGTTSLAGYVERMKPKQEHVYYMAGANREEVETSPFVEKLLRKGYEILYLVEAVDEYCVNSLPEFEGKKFQNIAKEGFSLQKGSKSKDASKKLNTRFEPLTKWLQEEALKDLILKAKLSERLSDSPCALVAGMFGWTANMERLAISNAHSKTHDSQKDFYLSQKKTLEINPRHPLIKELLNRVENDKNDDTAKKMAQVLFETATLRSGYMLKDTAGFAERIEAMMRQTLGVSADEKVDEEPEIDDADDDAEAGDTDDVDEEEDDEKEIDDDQHQDQDQDQDQEHHHEEHEEL